MGQRTFIILKQTYKDKAVINLIHHQWGYGKCMPSMFLQELLRYLYPLDTHAHHKIYESRNENYEGKQLEPIDIDFTFKPLNDEGGNYISNQIVDRDLDVFSIPVIKEYGNQTDNNNGGMIVEVIQKYKEDGSPVMYGDIFDVKIGFVLGCEELKYYNDKLNDSVPVEDEFGRVITAREYIIRTSSEMGNPNSISETTKKYIELFEGFCNLVGVEQVYNKEEEELIADKINTIVRTVEAFTKDLKEGETIDVPKELLEKVQVFA